MRNSLLTHDCLHVRKVQIDDRRNVDQVCNSLNSLLKDLIRLPESIRERCSAIHDIQKAIIRNDDQRIYIRRNVLNAGHCLLHSGSCLEAERLCHNAYGEDSLLLCKLRNDRCRTGSGSAAHSAGNKNHVCTLQCSRDFFRALFCRLLADLRIGSCSKTSCQLCSDLEKLRCLAALQSLYIRVHTDEFYSADFLFHHPVYSIVAGSANTYDDNSASGFVFVCFNLQHGSASLLIIIFNHPIPTATIYPMNSIGIYSGKFFCIFLHPKREASDTV